MPYHTIKFKLPDEDEELKIAMKASYYHSALLEIYQHCRGILKHGSKEERDSVLEKIRSIASIIHDD